MNYTSVQIMVSAYENFDKTGFHFTDNYNASDLVIGKAYDRLVFCSDFSDENCTTKIAQLQNMSANASY